jgi:uncharacterized membrane-anchored protein
LATSEAATSTKKASTLKLSLQTRNPRIALRLSRSMSEMAHLLIENGIAVHMTYADLRTLVKQHFEKQLDKAKSRITNNGRLAPEDRQGYEGNVRTGESAIKLDQCSQLAGG